MSAYSTENKITFSFITLKGNGENRRRIVVNYNDTFPLSDEQLGWGEDDLSATLTALKHQTYLHQHYKKEYYNLLKRLNEAGFVLKSEVEEYEED